MLGFCEMMLTVSAQRRIIACRESHMFNRVTISVTLMVTILVGPLACCCLWQQLLHSHPSAVKSSIAAVGMLAADEIADFCPSCRHTQASKPTDKPQQPLPTKCPCCQTKKLQSQIVEVITPPIVSDLQLIAFLPLNEVMVAPGFTWPIHHQEHFWWDLQTYLTDHCHRMRC